VTREHGLIVGAGVGAASVGVVQQACPRSSMREGPFKGGESERPVVGRAGRPPVGSVAASSRRLASSRGIPGSLRRVIGHHESKRDPVTISRRAKERASGRSASHARP
jgi:hypothetical protein